LRGPTSKKREGKRRGGRKGREEREEAEENEGGGRVPIEMMPHKPKF